MDRHRFIGAIKLNGNYKNGAIAIFGSTIYLCSIVQLPLVLMGVPYETFFNLSLASFLMIFILAFLAIVKDDCPRIEHISSLVFLLYLIGTVIAHITASRDYISVDYRLIYGLVSIVFLTKFTYLTIIRNRVKEKVLKQLRASGCRDVVNVNKLNLDDINFGHRIGLVRGINRFFDGKLPIFIGVGVCIGSLLTAQSEVYLELVFYSLWLLIVGNFTFMLANKSFLFLVSYNLSKNAER